MQILAYAAAGYITPSQSKACHDLLALIGHSIVARKTSTATETVVATVSRTLTRAEKLDGSVRAQLPDYGNLDQFTQGHGPAKEPVPLVIDAEEVTDTKPTVRLTRGRTP